MKTRIAIKNLIFSYAEALDGFQLGPLNLVLDPGKVYGWQGHNGSGKSTLASILAGVRKHTDGSIEGLPTNILYFQQNIAANIFPDLSVGEHFRLGSNGSRSRMIIEKFPSLKTHSAKYPDALSGGQLQRLAFSLALTRDFDLYLFDEVTNHLDEATSEIVGLTMREVVRDHPHVIVVFISHDRGFLGKFSDQTYSFEEGRICAES